MRARVQSSSASQPSGVKTAIAILAALALGGALALGSATAKADETTPRKSPLADLIAKQRAEDAAIEAKASDTRSDNEKRHVAQDHPDTEALIAGLKAKIAYLADRLEYYELFAKVRGDQVEELKRELEAAKSKDPANAPWWFQEGGSERFQLWADCKPVQPKVHVDDMTESGPKLTEESVQSAVESRLRSARLYNDLSGKADALRPILWIIVERFGERELPPYSINVALEKIHLDRATGLQGRSTSWRTASFGMGSPEFVRSMLAEQIDVFLAAYLRVNETKCGAR